MSDSRQNPPPRRKRGAQPGNRNAMKHGHCIRSPHLSADTQTPSPQMLELEAEEAILDQLIHRTLHRMDEQTMSSREWNASLRVLSLAIGRKESIHRTRKLPIHQETTIEQAIQELRSIDFEQD